MCAVSIGLVLFGGGAAATGSSNDALALTVGTPQLAQITSTAEAPAPWNEYQGDTEAAPYASNGIGTVYPTYTPGGSTTGTAGSATNPVEPNVAVFPGADSTTVNDAPYPAGAVGTPGTLDDYCGSGSNAVEGDKPVTASSVSRQPVGTLPLAPAYFPHIVENADGSLTGYFGSS